jgi:hypothetical protein
MKSKKLKKIKIKGRPPHLARKYDKKVGYLEDRLNPGSLNPARPTFHF